MWSKAYGGGTGEVANSVQRTSDGAYIVSGESKGDMLLMKVGQDGMVNWTKTYGGASGDAGYSVKKTADSGYIISGTTYSFGAGNKDAYLVKVDQAGTVAWSKAYGTSGEDTGNSVIQSGDGGYALTGKSSQDFVLMKLDSGGNF